MAFSRSLQKGQIPVTCNLCETETKINWKCMDCELLMCTKCKEKVHTKIKTAKNHKVIDIKEVGLHANEPDFSSIDCEEHVGQTCCMFCQSCDQLICPQCIAKVHNGHVLTEIKDGYEACIEQLKNGQKQVKINIDSLTNAEQKIGERKNSETTKYMEAKNHIQIHNAALKKAVDQHTENLMRELDEKWEDTMNIISSEQKRLYNMIKQLTDQNSTVDDIINSTDVQEVFKGFRKIEKPMLKTLNSPHLKFTTIPKFLPGQITTCNFGSLQDASDITINITEQFTTDISKVYFLSTNTAESLWISNSQELQKVKPEDKKLTTIRSYKIGIYNMAIMPSNDLLLASGSILKQIDARTGELRDSKYRVDPLRISAVHVTKDGTILLGVKSPGPAYSETGRRELIRINKDGAYEKIFENKQNSNFSFHYIHCMTSTNNGIAVVDKFTDEGKGRVVVMGQEGNVLNVYNGTLDSKSKDNSFCPVDMVTTPSHNILVSDLNSSIIHLLNNLGNLVTFFSRDITGIHYPCSMGFTQKGQLYIGCSTPKDSTEKAKLYTVNISGV